MLSKGCSLRFFFFIHASVNALSCCCVQGLLSSIFITLLGKRKLNHLVCLRFVTCDVLFCHCSPSLIFVFRAGSAS